MTEALSSNLDQCSRYVRLTQSRIMAVTFQFPLNVKRQAIDLCNLLDRAKEEQILLKEMCSSIINSNTI